MANHLRGEIAIKALGRDLVYRLGVNEMIELQNELGLAGQDEQFLGVFDEQRLRNLRTLRAITLYGLKRHQPEITEEQAGDVVFEQGLYAMADVIQQALVWALPERGAAGEEGAAGDGRPSPGPTSS
jgi:hypothetical protein